MPKKVMGPSTNAEPEEVESAEALAEGETQPDEELENGEELEAEEDLLEPLTLETADPNEPLWQDGPTVGQALEWKKQFKKIYVTSLSLDDHVLWRTLSRGAYADIMDQIETLNSSQQVSNSKAAMIQEELIAKACILFPEIESFDDELAGLPSLLSQQILEASGFVALDTRGL